MGYKPFMVTIQNQISVLNKILLIKEHQERQINVINESRKTPPGKRSRKTSSNQDSTNMLQNLTGLNSETCDNILPIPVKTSEEKSNKSCKSNGPSSEESFKKSDSVSLPDVEEISKEIQQSSQCIVS